MGQSLKDQTNLLGAENFIVKTEVRPPFVANAGPNEKIFANDPIQISADNIGESAVYQWFDSNGELVYTGRTFWTSPDENITYYLRVMANADGAVEYDDKKIEIKEGKIISASPNPVSSTLNVQYKVSNVNTAFIYITQPLQYGGNNYILNINQEETSIDFTNFASGVYNLILICDGIVQDVKSVQKL